MEYFRELGNSRSHKYKGWSTSRSQGTKGTLNIKGGVLKEATELIRTLYTSLSQETHGTLNTKGGVLQEAGELVKPSKQSLEWSFSVRGLYKDEIYKKHKPPTAVQPIYPLTIKAPSYPSPGDLSLGGLPRFVTTGPLGTDSFLVIFSL